MKKIGLFGGTFNPIHNGHLSIATQFCHQLQLDSVIFLPAGQPYHKQNQPISADHRLAMVQLAIESNPHFAVSDLDLIRQENTYTIDTVNIFKQHYPQATLWWLLGMDNLQQLHTWKNWQKLVTQTHIAVANRSPFSWQNPPSIFKNWLHSAQQNHSLIFLNTKEYPISSSEIRQHLQNGEDCSAWLPEKVYQYIQQYRLYQYP